MDEQPDTSARKAASDRVSAVGASRLRRLLIVRLTALGDAIHGLPVACALRDRLPGVEIGWLVEGRTADLLAGHPAIDRLIRVPRHWYKSPRAVRQLRKELVRHEFDVTVDLQSLTKSAVAAWLSGAPRRIGFGGEAARELSWLLNNVRVSATAVHVIDRYLELLAPLGIDEPRVRFGLIEPAAVGAKVEGQLRELGLPLRGFAVLNPGAGWPSKVWPADRYGELAMRLAAGRGASSLAVWGSDDELALARQIVSVSRGAAKLAPATSIPELAACCRRAALFVGSDTGPLHLAVAVGTPTVSLHGASRAEVCGAYGESNIRLQIRYQAGSARERRTADNSAICEITTDMVAKACGRLLEASAARKCG